MTKLSPMTGIVDVLAARGASAVASSVMQRLIEMEKHIVILFRSAYVKRCKCEWLHSGSSSLLVLWSTELL
jgi:hypothetical protein